METCIKWKWQEIHSEIEVIGTLCSHRDVDCAIIALILFQFRVDALFVFYCFLVNLCLFCRWHLLLSGWKKQKKRLQTKSWVVTEADCFSLDPMINSLFIRLHLECILYCDVKVLLIIIKMISLTVYISFLITNLPIKSVIKWTFSILL